MDATLDGNETFINATENVKTPSLPLPIWQHFTCQGWTDINHLYFQVTKNSDCSIKPPTLIFI